MENPQIQEAIALTDNLNDLLNLRAVAILHGCEYRFFDGGEEEVSGLLIRYHEMSLFPADIDKCKDPDTDRHQQDIEQDDSDDQAFV